MKEFFAEVPCHSLMAVAPVAWAEGEQAWFWGAIGATLFLVITLFGINRVLNHKMKKRVAETRASQERYKQVFATAGDAMFLLDQNSGSILESNAAAVALYGYDHDEFLELKNTDLSAEPKLTRNAIHEELRVAPIRYHRKKNGSVFPVEITANYYDQNGQRVSVVNIRDTTERERTERALRISEELKSKMVSNISDVIFIIDRDGITRYKSPNVEKWFGWKAEELLGRPSLEHVHPDDLSAIANAMAELARTPGSRAGAECRYRCANGQYKWIEISGMNLLNDPDIQGLLGSYHDITERKLTETALRESEERFRLLFENMTAGFALHEIIRDERGEPVDYRFLQINPAFENLTGLNAAETTGRTAKELLPGIEPAWLETFGAVERTGEARTFENYSEDLRKHFEVRAFRTVPGQFAAVFHDVTERVRSRETLEKSEAKYRDLFERSADPFLILEDYVFTDCNQAAVDLLGYQTKSQFIGSSPAVLSPRTQPDGSDSNEKAAELIKGLENKHNLRFEWYHQKASGEVFPVSVSLTKLEDLDGRVIIHTAWRDITERKRMEAAVEKRILALTQPMDSNERVEFETLFDLEELQRVQDEFAAATGVASIITRVDGEPITRPSNFSRFCRDIIRSTEKGCANCFRSDAELGRFNPEGPIVCPCLSAGLWDAGVSIVVGGRHIASWLIGQVRDETQTEEKMRAHARELGVDEERFIEAFREVPAMPRERFEKVAEVLFTLANQLSASAYQNVQQARFINERQKAEKSLSELAEIQSAILDNSTMGIALIEGRVFKWVNVRMSELFQIDQAKLSGNSTRVLYASEDDYLKTGERAYAALMRNERCDITQKFRRADGSTFWCRLIGKALDPARPRDGGSIWMFEDISDRMEHEIELSRLSTAIEQSPETIVITDPDGLVQYVNPAFERISGYTRDEVIGENPRVLKSGEHGPEFYSSLWETITAGQVWEGRLINRRKDGARYTEEASIAPVKDAEGRVVNYVAVKRDITAELARADELRQAQKMDAIGQLAGGLAHDFNNILQGIMGFSEILQFSLEEESLEWTNAREITHSAQYAAELTRQLLTFSRKQPASLESLDLNGAVHDAQALLDVLLGERVEIVLDLQDDLPPLRADQSQLTQIIMNLAVNARDAMPNGGRLTISTESLLFRADDAAKFIDAKSGRYLRLSITDTGQGMTPEVQSKLFEPFFTTKAVGSGTGLGLSVVYGIVKQNNGWINVYSAIGEGTCFKIHFPIEVTEEEPLESPREAVGEPETAAILLVEDDPDVARVIAEILRAEQHEIILAPSAEEALTRFEERRGAFDLLISDMVLPGLRGDELADELRRKSPSLPVLLLSGYRDHETRWKHLARTDYRFMNKPFANESFLSLVKKTINLYK